MVTVDKIVSKFVSRTFLLQTLTIGRSSIGLQVHLRDLAVLDLESKSLATSSAQDGSSSVEAHIQSLCKLGRRVGDESKLISS